MRFSRLLAGTFISLVLASCGGGGGGASGAPSSILKGTAATGAPITNGTVSIQDSLGKTITTTTDENGAYSIDVSSLTPPLIIKLEGDNSDASKFSLYSAIDKITQGTQTTANVTPLTNATILIATGQTGADFYANPAFSKITTQSLTQSNQALRSELANVIAATNTSSQVDFIKSDFSANKSNVDLMMEYINVKNKPPQTAGDPASVAIMGKVAKGGKFITPPTGGISNGTLVTQGSFTNQNLPTGIDFGKIDTLVSQINIIFNSGTSVSSRTSALVDLSDPNFLNDGIDRSAFWQQKMNRDTRGSKLSNVSIVGCNFSTPFACDITGLLTSNAGSVQQSKLTITWSGSDWRFYGNHKSTNSRVITTLFRETYFTDTDITRHAYSGFEVVVNTEGSIGSTIDSAKLFLLKNGSWQLIDSITDHFGSSGSSFIYKEVQLTDAQIDDFYNAAISTGISSKLEMYDAASNLIATDYLYGIDLPLKSAEVANVQIPEITDSGIQQFRNYNGGKTLQLNLDPKSGFFSPSQFYWNQFSSAGQEISTTDIGSKSKTINITFKNTVNMPSDRNRGIDFYGFDSEGRPFHTRNVGCNANNCVAGTP
jgi:hypothetical protein